MIQIRNITKGQSNQARASLSTKFGGSSGFPAFIDLPPGAHIEVPQQNVKDWHPAVKQNLAEFVSHDILRLYEIDSVHQYQDKGNNVSFSRDYLIDAPAALALAHALDVAESFNTEMQHHFDNVSVHNAIVGAISAAVPTDLATLIVWIADAQTEYSTHRASVGAHVNIDTINTITPVVAADLATSVAALRELYTAYHSHKMWFGSAVELGITAILNY